MPSTAEQIAERLGGTTPAPPDDLAFRPPEEPLSETRLKAEAGVVRRDIPIVTISTFWTPVQIRHAFAETVAGRFDSVAQLIDTLIGDSRVASGLDSRVGGLLGRPIERSIPKKYRDSALAKECFDAFEEAWPMLAAEPMLAGLQTWAILLGHSHAQLVWDTTGEYAIPYPRIWHPRFTYYDWTYRTLVAVTQDGQVPIAGGDGHWILHAPHGEYRGWMRGAVRAIAPWWLSRNYALRDASRWSEVHGLPLKKLKHPASADRGMVARWRNSVANMGGETCVDLPQNVSQNEAGSNYDIEYLEAQGKSFDGFFSLIDACDREITLALLAQTLTSSVGPEGRGSYAAARVHADVRQALLEADARLLARTVYKDLARPFAAMNFGNADLAPEVRWNIEPYEDGETRARTALTVTQTLVNLANAGWKVADPERFARQFGVNLGRLAEAAGIAPPPGKPPSDVAAAASGAPRKGTPAQARFVAMAEQYARYRIATGASERDLAAETEALAALLDEQKRAQAPRRRMVR